MGERDYILLLQFCIINAKFQKVESFTSERHIERTIESVIRRAVRDRERGSQLQTSQGRLGAIGLTYDPIS